MLVKRWRPAKCEINKIKMEVSSTGKYILYTDYLALKDEINERELNWANAYHELEKKTVSLLTRIEGLEKNHER